MSKKRKGVDAGICLVDGKSKSNLDLWEHVEHHEDAVVAAIDKLPALVKFVNDIRQKSVEREYFTKEDLQQIIGWKHAVGKPRPYNVKLVNSNAEGKVVSVTREAIRMAREVDAAPFVSGSSSDFKILRKVIDKMTELSGVGPASASAMLCLLRPELFCYMYDEAIDTFENKRDYNVQKYLRVNSQCLKIAQGLGDGWTTARVAKAVWVASRHMAITGENLTASSLLTEKSNEITQLHSNPEERTAKRQRRQTRVRRT